MNLNTYQTVGKGASVLREFVVDCFPELIIVKFDQLADRDHQLFQLKLKILDKKIN
jgi:hypothetical protein